MENKNDISSEESPMLTSLAKGPTGFSTPPSYFDELPAKIMDRIHSSEKKRSFFLTPAFSIPSLAVLAGAVALGIYLKTDALPPEIELSDIELAHVIENPELYNIDPDVITEEYLSANYEPILEETDISDEEIKAYLEENTDATNIINEY